MLDSAMPQNPKTASMNLSDVEQSVIHGLQHSTRTQVTNCYGSISRLRGRGPSWSTLPITKTDMARVLNEWGSLATAAQHPHADAVDAAVATQTVTPRSYKLSVPGTCVALRASPSNRLQCIPWRKY